MRVHGRVSARALSVALEGKSRVKPGHTRVCTPSLRAWVRVSTTRLPQGWGWWVSQGQESLGAREGPGRGNTFAGDKHVSVRGGNTCARVGLGLDDPYSHHPPSSAPQFKRPGGFRNPV